MLAPGRAVKEGVWGPGGGAAKEHPVSAVGLGDRGRCGWGGAVPLGGEREAEVGEDGAGHGRVRDGGDDAQPAATAGAGESIEIEHAVHQRRPGPGVRGDASARRSPTAPPLSRCGCDIVRLSEDQEAALGVRFALFPELLRTSDVVSLHVPLNAATRNMMGAREFALTADRRRRARRHGPGAATHRSSALQARQHHHHTAPGAAHGFTVSVDGRGNVIGEAMHGHG